MSSEVPTFFLYGEPHKRVEDGFVHVESLEDRSRPSGWIIRPHSHAALAHIIYLASGGGEIVAGGRRLDCPAPCLLLVPSSVVHGFNWERETTGSVVTLATRRLSGLSWLAPETAGLLSEADVVALPAPEAARIERCIAELRLELGWSKIGHDAAVQASLLALLVSALRQRSAQPAGATGEGRRRAVVARMRERIEERYRLREPVAAYAAALGISETALRLACAKVAGSPPQAMIDERTLIEARRSLIFSNMSVSEIAYSLGFEDPAYFSRFFTKHIGRSPRDYRSEQRRKQAS